ncbi:hypothetical protein CLOM_g12394 [Closterium sp. NIES-68]|nr:hypothetical protein CLOM_g12394 [Closterium sp. NIES-68]GJP82849.1 hypothetical protein CLOP_g13076 [Closterium sp. NIES-67]
MDADLSPLSGSPVTATLSKPTATTTATITGTPPSILAKIHCPTPPDLTLIEQLVGGPLCGPYCQIFPRQGQSGWGYLGEGYPEEGGLGVADAGAGLHQGGGNRGVGSAGARGDVVGLGGRGRRGMGKQRRGAREMGSCGAAAVAQGCGNRGVGKAGAGGDVRSVGLGEKGKGKGGWGAVDTATAAPGVAETGACVGKAGAWGDVGDVDTLNLQGIFENFDVHTVVFSTKCSGDVQDVDTLKLQGILENSKKCSGDVRDVDPVSPGEEKGGESGEQRRGVGRAEEGSRESRGGESGEQRRGVGGGVLMAPLLSPKVAPSMAEIGAWGKAGAGGDVWDVGRGGEMGRKANGRGERGGGE